MRLGRTIALGVLVACGVALVLGLRSGAGSATGSRLLSALRHPSTAPLPVPSGFPAAKAARFEAMDRLRQRAASIPAKPPSSGSTGAGLVAGILGLHDGGPFGPAQFLGTNLWNGRVGNRWLVVQAGGVPTSTAATAPRAKAAATAKAGLLVYSRSLRVDSPRPRVLGVIRAPGDPTGELTVDSVRGKLLELSLMGSRHTFRFDVAKLRFVAEKGS